MWCKIIILTIAVIVVDQLTKFYILQNVLCSIPLIGDFVRITPIQNPYAIFGLQYNMLLIPLSIVAICIILLILYKSKSCVFSLILGGAIGNLIDRIRINAVTDWIDIGIGTLRWPIFNIADSAITIGIVWLIVREVFKRKGSEK